MPTSEAMLNQSMRIPTQDVLEIDKQYVKVPKLRLRTDEIENTDENQFTYNEYEEPSGVKRTRTLQHLDVSIEEELNARKAYTSRPSMKMAEATKPSLSKQTDGAASARALTKPGVQSKVVGQTRTVRSKVGGAALKL